jgi:hypothetical protein
VSWHNEKPQALYSLDAIRKIRWTRHKGECTQDFGGKARRKYGGKIIVKLLL